MKKKWLIGVTAAVIVVSGSAYGTFANYSVSSSSLNKVNAASLSIQEKMLNSIDLYENVKGSYHVYMEPLKQDSIVEFNIQQGKNPGSYVKIKNKNESAVTEVISDGVNQVSLNEQEKSFSKVKLPKIKSLSSEKRSYKDAEGKPVYIHRQDPAGSFAAHEVVFPQNYAFWLVDPAKYQIVGEEVILGRSATVIQGKLDSMMAEKHRATEFKFWVDTQTGVMLKLEEKDQQGKITNSIKVLSIEFDKGIDREKLQIQVPAGWKDNSIQVEKKAK
ncbi:sigma-E factor regulatory protein RseB domain-containing protein [Paenibacillus lutrae]|uniref:MucB/RseB N-terminal domain-containing protein n=1 Tax=Paenibacillus lutrae TaxID=2078573 RepID=A0A7X3FJP0_9BACL|nr:sigma-E factor regulatory protein RseB domain-containing protein [Paenibacillus lutrae]MVP01004.1 hypothetical protein [Paenibacillus lutrae]